MSGAPRAVRFVAPVLFASLLGLSPAGGAPERVDLLAADDQGVSFLLYAPEGEAAVVERAGEPPTLELDGFASIPASNGWQMPARTVWVAVVPQAEISFESRTLDRVPLEIGRSGKAPFRVEGLPARSVQVGEAAWMRNQRVVPVTWMPVVGGSAGAVRERTVRVDLRFAGGRPYAGGGPSGDRWEDLYRHTLVNYESGQGWRRPATPRVRRQGDSFSTTTNPWLRIEVGQHGLYEVTGTDLQAAQIDLAAVLPDKVRLFTGSGLSLHENRPVTELPDWLDGVAIRLEGTEDGTFDPQDRILFYGLGPDGWYADYARPDALYERYRTDEFSNVNTYWLSWGDFQGQPRRWTEVDGRQAPTIRRTSAPDRVHFESNEFWDPHPWEDLPGREEQILDSLPAWEKWHWLEIEAGSTERRSSVSFHLPTPDPTETGRILTRLWGATYNSSSLPDHFIRVDLAGDSIAGTSWYAWNHVDVAADGVLFDGEDQQLGLVAPYVKDTTAVRVDHSYLAWFEVDYARRLVWAGGDLAFLVPPGSERVGYEVLGIVDTSGIVVLDRTDPLRTRVIVPRFEREGTGYRMIFGLDPDPGGERRIVIADRTAAASATQIVRDTAPADGYLRERVDPVDYIVITGSSALSAASRLAAWREEHSPYGTGFRTAAVDIQDIYDEFSAGRADPTAIRNFLHFAHLNWNGGNAEESPSYVCILGDATYDFRARRGRAGDLIVPTYEGYFVVGLLLEPYSPHFGSDDWLVLFDEAPDPFLDMAIGRLPADSPASAEAVVDKVIAYESSQRTDGWRQRFTLIADDICQGLEQDYPLYFTHTRQTEELADGTLPVELERDRIYLYEYGTECVYDRKPDAAAALRTSIDRGTLVINYTGHGSEEQLADERVLETRDVAGMTNADRLFFFLTASCSVGKFDFAGEGLGEALVRQPAGGAIGVFSATAVAFSGSNAQLNREFFRAVFPGGEALRSQPFGLASVIAKGEIPRPERVGNRRYPLLGEPAVRLPTPALRIRLQIEGIGADGSAAVDTIYRGALVRVVGQIEDLDGNRQEGFNGSVDFHAYDSEVVRQASVQFSSVEYNLNGAPIFRGGAPVSAGAFESRFLAPAALRTGERGDALVYAFGVSGDEIPAFGGRAGILVPEVPPPSSTDQEGPEIRLTVDGDLDHLAAGARWEATLIDSSGINITQLVASRSVRLRIEQGSRQVHLEDLAAKVRFPEDYRVGQLEFTLPDGLEGGQRYLLTLSAYDNRDHQGSASVEFFLVGGGPEGLALGRVYNVPNPIDRETTFFLEMNRTADVTIRIFTASGKLIRRIRPGSIPPAQAAGIGILWDGRDEDGDRLANGVYFYKVSVRGEDGTTESRIERLAVLR